MYRPLQMTLAGLCLALAGSLGLPQVWAYTSAAIRTGSSGGFQVVTAQPSGGAQPLVYCTAGDITINRGAGVYGDVPITCFNGMSPHSVTLSISYSVSPANPSQPPAYSPSSPISLTISGASATTNLRVTTANNTTRATYTVSYTAGTTGTPAVQVSGLSFQSQFVVQ